MIKSNTIYQFWKNYTFVFFHLFEIKIFIIQIIVLEKQKLLEVAFVCFIIGKHLHFY